MVESPKGVKIGVPYACVSGPRVFSIRGAPGLARAKPLAGQLTGRRRCHRTNTEIALMRLLRNACSLVLVLLILSVAAFTWGRLRPPTAQEEKTLAELSKNTKPGSGRNAYPSLWFLGFDVPIEQAGDAYGILRRRMASADASTSDGDPMSRLMPGVSPLSLVSSDDWDVLCRGRDADCLDKVQAHIEKARSLLSAHATLLDQERNLSNFDYVWSDMPGPLMASFPIATGQGSRGFPLGHSSRTWKSNRTSRPRCAWAP